MKIIVGGITYKANRMKLRGIYCNSVLANISCGNRSNIVPRDGKYFQYILNFYYSGEELDLPNDRSILNHLLNESKWYKLPKLSELIVSKLDELGLQIGDHVRIKQEAVDVMSHLDYWFNLSPTFMYKTIMIEEVEQFRCMVCQKTWNFQYKANSTDDRRTPSIEELKYHLKNIIFFVIDINESCCELSTKTDDLPMFHIPIYAIEFVL